MKFTFPPESQPLEGYTIKRGIHRGGFGEVYYALSHAGKEVALKLLQQNEDVELRGVAQCLNLKHPNLVTIFDVRTDKDGDHWIIMEYMSGKSLDRVLARHPQGLPMEQVRFWLSGIVAGLDYLHDRGIVHRDLKPGNIFEDQGIVKIGDVGLSKFISQSRRGAQTQSVGTVYYMAPEVARGTYGREVDLYALGVMVYELITGHVPFDGETAGEILMKHLSEKPDLSVLPGALRPVLAKALAKDPHRRYQSVREFEADFLAATNAVEQAGVEPAAVPSVPPRMAPPPARSGDRRRAAAAGAAQGAVAVDVPPWYVQNATFLKLLGIGLLVLAVPGFGLDLTPRALLLLGGVAALAAGLRHAIDLTPPPPPRRSHRPTPPGRHQSLRHAVYHRPRPGRQFGPYTPRRVSWHARFGDICAAFPVAVASTALLTAMIYLVTDLLPDLSSVALFALTTILAAWLVLIVSKLMEGRRVEGLTRRVIFLFTGLAVGAGAFLIDQAFLAETTDVSEQALARFDEVGRHALMNAQQQPTLAGYMVFFGLLFALRRWWWHADAFRSTRLKISSALVTLLLAYVIVSIFAFPTLWGLLWAVTISCVLQLSAPWVVPEQRRVDIQRNLNA